jgi:uncharacterized protein YndB with AHSA1/START domain
MTPTNRTLHTRAAEQSLTFSRRFAAPAPLVFRAHVDPELFVRWMGPRGSAIHLEHFDARAGGAFRFRAVMGWTRTSNVSTTFSSNSEVRCRRE